MSPPQEGLAALRAAAESGELDELCARHRVRILTVFGSAARDEPHPRDLDIGVMFEPDTDPDYLAIINELTDLTRTDAVDFVHLNRTGPLTRERALVGSIPLFEGDAGAFAGAQIAAVLEPIDTDWMRRLNLELPARTPGGLDWRSPRAKLHKINDLLDDLVALGEFDLQRMREDRMAGLAVERILTLIVDLAVSVNSHVTAVELGQVADTYAESFPLAAQVGIIDRELGERLRPSAEMRNVLIHDYVTIDHQKLVDAIPAAIDQYGQYVRQVARWLLDRQTG